jgi:adenine-specific DNA-methyltransferase
MARKKKDATPAVPDLDAIRHKETRANIPTEELRDFVADDEAKPSKMLYPRDPSLDPQLVWKGKDEQDREPLEVDVVPIYIQEVIEPRVVIDAVQARKTTKPDNGGFLPGFFDDFDTMDFDHKVEFYQHDQHWANRMILGNSLHVMTSLAEKEGLKGKVQMIYIDPPYGIKFGSNWQVSTRKRDVKDGKIESATRQPEQIRAFRDTWILGIHSYLGYLRDRLGLCRELLTESGSLFVQIGDENVHLIRSIMDEIFGTDNFVSSVTFVKTTGAGSFSGGTNVIASVSDYLICYAKNKETMKYRPVWLAATKEQLAIYKWLSMSDGSYRAMRAEELRGEVPIPDDARLYTPDNLTSQTVREAQTTVFPVEMDGNRYLPGKGGWKTDGNAEIEAGEPPAHGRKQPTIRQVPRRLSVSRHK